MLSVAEEGGGGKVMLIEKGAYEGMDACVMYVVRPEGQRQLNTST